LANSYKNNVIRIDVVGNSAAVVTGSGRVIAVLVVGGSAVADIKLYNALTVTGDPFFEFGDVPINASDGMAGFNADFTTGLSVALVGTAAVAYIYLD